MCAPVCHSGCFVFGVIINILLLALTIWAAKSEQPFAVWVSLLVAFLFCFVYQVTINSPPTDAFRLRPVSEDVQQNALYQRMLEERPLPPIPARNPSRPSIYSAVLASPLSDPFINGSALPQPIRLSAREGGVTIRQVPAFSCMFNLVFVFLSVLLTTRIRCFAYLSFYTIASPLGGRKRQNYDDGTMRLRIG
ncbi:hypothetical protein D6C77_04726 [Aureobasidium pullulans]|nr:hypothetical protein D6C77_04726 [Aureobasidium pullulans]